MAFPVDAARVGTNGSTAATNKVCNLPTGIASGHQLVLELRSAGADTHSTPTGWTALVLNNNADASNDVVSVFWRIADGTEGATVTVTATASLKFAAICWRITGAGTPQISAAATGASATPDPPSFTPTGGAQDYLWLWVGSWEGEQTSPPAGNPTNYSNPFGAATGEGGAIATNCRAAGATRQFNAATEDPPSWTISVIDDWTAWTIAVPPSLSSQTISGAGNIASAEAFGAGKVNQRASPPSISPAEVFGTLVLALTIALAGGIGSAEAFGLTKVNPIVRSSAIVSVEAFGSAQIGRAHV